MRIAKPLLIVLTPIGVIGGLMEAYRLAGGMVVVMIMMLLVVGTGLGSVFFTIRRERREREAAREALQENQPPSE